MEYVVGIDGGGTKTALEVRNVDGTMSARATFGPMNLNGANDETVHATLCNAAAWLSTLSGEVGAICIGSAGVSNADAVQRLEAILREEGLSAPAMLVGDHETALVGAMGGISGAVLIAGTGSSCYGQLENGKSKRTGGWGFLIDDEGSGYAVGRDVLKAVVRTYDGRAPFTLLTKLVLDFLDARKIEDIIAFLYAHSTTKDKIAALSPLWGQALQAGDNAAQLILEKASTELTTLAIPVVRALSLEKGEIALMGGLLTKNEALHIAVSERLISAFPLLQCIQPRGDAASGAALMAVRMLVEQRKK